MTETLRSILSKKSPEDLVAISQAIGEGNNPDAASAELGKFIAESIADPNFKSMTIEQLDSIAKNLTGTKLDKIVEFAKNNNITNFKGLKDNFGDLKAELKKFYGYQ